MCNLGKESVLWYPWGPASASQCKLYLCKDCWVYWKKCGGLKKSTKTCKKYFLQPTSVCHKYWKVFAV